MGNLLIGDQHLKQSFTLPAIDEILSTRASIGRAVFLGDACDDWGADGPAALSALSAFAEWVQARRSEGLIVDVLLGNHDFCYIRGCRGPGTMPAIMREARELLEGPLNALIACAVGPHLCTHAGVVRTWARRCLPYTHGAEAADIAQMLVDMREDAGRWRELDSCPPSRGGWSLPGPLWADLRDLADDPLPGLSQVVGHSPVESAGEVHVWDPEGSGAAVFACDSMSLTGHGDRIGDGSMLVAHEDGAIERVEFPGGAGAFAEAVERYIGSCWR